ncbi:MAG: outer membrane beta-barrel protein [Gammaproteobacteria bacterium]|nr:outer membrane beta-barrel protein [Gammaproteobacteria bacterium]
MNCTGKKIVLCTLLFCWTNLTYAIGEGLYIGLMAGLARNNGKPIQASLVNDAGFTQSISVTPNKQMGAVRPYLGYKFNNYAGAEIGGTYYTVVNFNQSQINTNSTSKSGIATVDFVLLGSFSFRDLFEVYGKAGAAVIYQGTSTTISMPPPNKSKYETYVKPTYTLGAGYTFNGNWVVDLSYTRLSNVHYFNNIDYYAIGFAYHFVNRYCGQFLCD